ncbi:DUF167 domain-containing protein [Fulvimarina sp. 2208YS6-2-32]|uniref:UPF0235 protein U0C82_03500 n=1 Tax=Fulvimarina uroteuthidis TaxID=3098149 RepID=A0ABU5HYV0_9HYPH|nr:DUF167 domain-containing protein [Fulvimarina sp. 2208YS6-2-32]MDY8108215.1 DUF167 domain-containing protein [Fulvimarina sp. 2208YS6-2-32]
MPEPFLQPVEGGMKLFVRVTPKASLDRVGGVSEDGAGRLRLQLKLRAVPEEGRANAALVKLVAKVFGVAKTSVSVVAGHANRSKTVLIEGEHAALAGVADRLGKSPS